MWNLLFCLKKMALLFCNTNSALHSNFQIVYRHVLHEQFEDFL